MDNITVNELEKLISRVKLIDIRDNYQYNLGTIPTARNIPSHFLEMNPENYINQDDIYYIFCEYGESSQRCCMILKRKGYKAVNVIGGYSEYKRIKNDYLS